MEYLETHATFNGHEEEVFVEYDFTPCDGGDRDTPPSGASAEILVVTNAEGENITDQLSGKDEERIVEECIIKSMD